MKWIEIAEQHEEYSTVHDDKEAQDDDVRALKEELRKAKEELSGQRDYIKSMDANMEAKMELLMERMLARMPSNPSVGAGQNDTTERAGTPADVKPAFDMEFMKESKTADVEAFEGTKEKLEHWLSSLRLRFPK